MVLDMFKLDQGKSVYIAFFLFKSIEKELNSLSESLRKETPDSAQDSFREFKTAVEKESEAVKGSMSLIRDLIEEDGEWKLPDVEGRRSDIVRSYLDGVRVNREE